MTDTVNVQREPTQAEIEAVFDILDSGELGEDFCSADVCRAMLAAAPKAEPVDIAALDRLFYGGKAYIGAEEAVRQISDLQSELAAIRAQPAAPKAEPVSDPYKLVTAANLIAWVDKHPYPTSWVATREDIKAIVEQIAVQPLSNPQQLEAQPEAQKGEPVGEVARVIDFAGDPTEVVWADKMPPAGTKLYTHPAPSSELLEVAEALIPIARKDTRLGKAGDNLRKALNRLEDAIAKHKGPQS